MMSPATERARRPAIYVPCAGTGRTAADGAWSGRSVGARGASAEAR